MQVIYARNVNDAYYQGLQLLLANGEKQTSRAGVVLVYPAPVMTVYSTPKERVLFDPLRDANPFFHLAEALWMLAGRNDATWLDRFIKDYSERFGERDGAQHGAYGHRWRKAFGFDQLDTVIKRLKKSPYDRQCVIQMWDATPQRTAFTLLQEQKEFGWDDLQGDWKDRPCNTHIYLRVRSELVNPHYNSTTADPEYYRFLDMTVCCRSNDAVWGAYGANAVHFSVLQEYLAENIGVRVGKYYQFSNNFHVYTDILPKIKPLVIQNPYLSLGKVHVSPIVTAPIAFDGEVSHFIDAIETSKRLDLVVYRNTFLQSIAAPMFRAYAAWRAKQYEDVKVIMNTPELRASDWGIAAQQWFARRLQKV